MAKKIVICGCVITLPIGETLFLQLEGYLMDEFEELQRLIADK